MNKSCLKSVFPGYLLDQALKNEDAFIDLIIEIEVMGLLAARWFVNFRINYTYYSFGSKDDVDELIEGFINQYIKLKDSNA